MPEYYEDITDELDRLVCEAQLLEFDVKTLSGKPVLPANLAPREPDFFGFDALDGFTYGAIQVPREALPLVRALQLGGPIAVIVIAVLVSLFAH